MGSADVCDETIRPHYARAGKCLFEIHEVWAGEWAAGGGLMGTREVTDDGEAGVGWDGREFGGDHEGRLDGVL